MSILGKILGGIFNRKKPAPTATQTSGPATFPQPTSVTPAPSAATAQAQNVDVAGILDFMNEGRDEKLNWRTSIVDLMKLTGMDSSLAERKELADELGYTGDKSDSASMNIWLHAQVIQKIKDNGGQITDMTD